MFGPRTLPELRRLSTRFVALLLAVGLGLGATPLALRAGGKKYEKIPVPKLREVQVPVVERKTLANGLELFLLEDPELPLFRMRLTIKAGSAHEPKDKRALAAITSDVLRSGGSEALAGDEMDEILEGIGGSIETYTDDLESGLSVNVLIEDAPRAAEMLRDLLLRPAFPQDKIDLDLKQRRSGIARRNDEPTSIADREIQKILRGKDHPLAAQVEYEHLDRITRQDLVEFHRKYYHPTHAYLAVWGSFDTAEVVQLIEKTLGTWPRAQVTLPQIPDTPPTSASVNLVVKESVNQSNIRMGHRGTTAKDPDLYALTVMNEILGGSFGSRLFNEVRSKQGLSYGVGSALGAGLAYSGTFRVVAGTKSETTVKAVRACIQEVRRMKNEPITSEELERAKSGILNAHVFNFSSRGAIVNRQVRYAMYDYPADFLEQYAKRIEQVGVADVQRAAQKYLQPDQFAILVVGKPSDFDEALDALGPVNEIDITIPEPPVTVTHPAPTPETLAQGKSILQQAAKALGGVKQLDKIEHMTKETDLTLQMMGQSLPGKLTQYVRYPGQSDRHGSSRSEINIMGQTMVQVYDGTQNVGFMRGPQGSKDFDSSELEEAREEHIRDVVECLRNYEAYNPQFLSQAKVEDTDVDVVLMTPEGGGPFKIYIDRKTHLVVKQDYNGRNMQGAPVYEEVFLGNYQKVGNVLLPHKETVHQDGEPFLTSVVKSIELGKIPKGKFQRSES